MIHFSSNGKYGGSLKNSIKKLPTVTVSDIARLGVGLNLLVSIVVSIALVLDDNDSRTLTK